MALPQLLSPAVDGAGAAAGALHTPGTGRSTRGSGGDSATCTRGGARARPAHVGSRGSSPGGKFYQRSVPGERRVPARGWGTGHQLPPLEPVQSQGQVPGGTILGREKRADVIGTHVGKVCAGEPLSWRCQTLAANGAPCHCGGCTLLQQLGEGKGQHVPPAAGVWAPKGTK